MKVARRIQASLVAMPAVAWWPAAGAHRGWTQTNVPVKTLNEVPGIAGIRDEKRFVPALDFLGGALPGAGFLAGASFLFRKPQLPSVTPS